LPTHPYHMKLSNYPLFGSIIFLALPLMYLTSCTELHSSNNPPQSPKHESRQLALFEPEGNKVLVFAGQDLASIGGLPNYQEGYVDHFGVPAGVTLYTSIAGGADSYGDIPPEGLQGIYETFDNGNGPSNMQMVMSDDTFDGTALAIGLSLVNHEQAVADGSLDANIHRLGEYLLSLGDRPVFLRIGYEFDGHTWNHYDREAYLKAFRRIRDKLEGQGVKNTAYVWQSVGWVSTPALLEEWYPGDAYVDWCAFSFFDRWREVEMIDFARKKEKPVFIAEASVAISDHMAKFTGATQETRLSNPEQAQQAWDEWFVPFFTMIEENQDVVKAIHYINCNWSERPMWKENPTFQKLDCRLQASSMIAERWREKMALPLYQQHTPELSDIFRLNTPQSQE
ncbi:MAG: glycosyl hydrolase, partial [Bacteroidota bacterium]